LDHAGGRMALPMGLGSGLVRSGTASG
jgi:hypothetical protein